MGMRLASGKVFREHISSSRVCHRAVAKCFNMNNDGVKCELSLCVWFLCFVYHTNKATNNGIH